MKDVKVKQLSSILDFMYNGRVYIEIDLMESFLTTAQELWVKGLTHEDNLALNCKTPSSKKIAAGRNLDLELSLRRHDGDTAAEIQSHTPSRIKLKPGLRSFASLSSLKGIQRWESSEWKGVLPIPLMLKVVAMILPERLLEYKVNFVFFG